MNDEPKEQSAAAEILAYSKRVDAALKEFAARTHYEPATNVTPLHHLLASEDGQLDEWSVVRETAVRLLQWIAAEGPHPARLLRRLFVLGDHMMIEPYCLLTLREKGKLLNESHGAQLWALNRIAVDPLMRRGCRSINGSGQKGMAARAAASDAQQGNRNRANSVNSAAKRGTRRKQRQPKKRP